MNLALLVASCVAGSSISFMEEKPIFKEPMAAPRTPSSALTVQTEKYEGFRIYYIESVLGKDFPIVTLTVGDWAIQSGIQGAGWFNLGYKEGAFPMLTQDFYFSFPLSFRYKDFSGSFKLNHISSHQGDGIDILLRETLTKEEEREFEFYKQLADQAGVDVNLTKPIRYSRDYLSLHLAYRYKMQNVRSRVYVHGGRVHKSRPKFLKRWFVGNGMELAYPMNYVAPYYSQDITWNQDLDSVDYSMQCGIIMLPHKRTYHKVRLAITGFVGYDRRGQLLGRKLKRIGFGLFIQ
jgi:hypothetical protein